MAMGCACMAGSLRRWGLVLVPAFALMMWQQSRMVTQVTCGGHHAERCADCPGPGNPPERCHGDCKWQKGGLQAAGCVPIKQWVPPSWADQKGAPAAAWRTLDAQTTWLFAPCTYAVGISHDCWRCLHVEPT